MTVQAPPPGQVSSFIRFPLLNTMRWGYRIAAGLTALGSLVLLVGVAVAGQDATVFLLAVLLVVMVVPVAVVSMLVLAEGITVVLAIEDHLWHLRQGDAGATTAQAAPAKSWRAM